MNLRERYKESLRNLPPPGHGCHPRLLAVADYGVIAGLTAAQIFDDLRRFTPAGNRRIHDQELTDAINKALSDHNGGTFTPRPRLKPVVKDGKAALQKIISQGKTSDEADLSEISPIRLLEEPKDDPALLLENLYEPADLIWIGEWHQTGIETIRTAGEWVTYSRNGGKTARHIISNPMTGLESTTKDGRPSYRCDNTVKTYKYCVVEFDNLSREDQIRFWSAVRLPVVCLIDSGGKSIHAWLDVQKLARFETFEQWTTYIKSRLYDRILTPMGVDGQCSNPSRLSRLPGHYREEKGAYQRLLWLSPEGRPIAC